MTKWLARGIFGFLAAWTLAFVLLPDQASRLPVFLLFPIAAAYLAFALATLRLLRQRKRPPDATTYFWGAGMLFLVLGLALWLAGTIYPALQKTNSYPLITGVLFIAGFVISIVNGMLYKIVPFLIWYHLQNQITDRRIKAPNVRDVISDATAMRQFRVHVAAVLLLAAASLWPQVLARPAGVVFGISAGWLAWNLVHAVLGYREFIRTRLSPGHS